MLSGVKNIAKINLQLFYLVLYKISRCKSPTMGQSFISLTPLIDTKTGIFCHLLEIYEVKIIIDCGIGQDFDYSIYESVQETINDSHCILLTSFDMKHMGAVGLFPNVPVYCSIPTAVLGRIVLDSYRVYLEDRKNRAQAGERIDLDGSKSHLKAGKSSKNSENFSKVLNIFNPKQIKFSQPFKIKDVEISCYNAGYILGNSAFKITTDLQSITVCYNFNHRKENLLNGIDTCTIASTSIFITNSEYVNVRACTIKARDQSIVDNVKRGCSKISDDSDDNIKKIKKEDEGSDATMSYTQSLAKIPGQWDGAGKKEPEVLAMEANASAGRFERSEQQTNEIFECEMGLHEKESVAKNETSNACAGKTIITVSYARLLELLCILHQEDKIVVSLNASLFYERTKSMIEWAGSKAPELLNSTNTHFGRISDIGSHKIVIVVEEMHPYGYLGTVLEKYNSPESMLLLFDRKESDFFPESLNIYDFSYHKKEIVSPELKADADSDSSSEEPEHEHWSHCHKTVFFSSLFPSNYTFPQVKKRRQNNLYGEPVLFEFQKKIEESSLKDISQEHVEVIETATVRKTGLTPLFRVRHMDMPGMSDWYSCKTVLEGFDPQRVIFANDYEDCALFLSTACKVGKISIESDICREKLHLGALSLHRKVLISEKIMSLEFKSVLNKKISKFKARVADGIVDVAGDYDPLTIGIVNLAMIKKYLVENGYQVEDFGLYLLVDQHLKVFIGENSFKIEAEDQNLLVGVREILYKFLLVV